MSVLPGWYPDPADPETQRYWDGEQWIGAPIPVGAEPPATPPPLPTPPTLPQATLPPGTLQPSGTLLPGGYPHPNDPHGPAPHAQQPHAPTPDSVEPREPHPHMREIPAAWTVETTPILTKLAPLWKRLCARLIDIGVVSVLIAVVNSYFFYEYVLEIWPPIKAYWNASFAGGRPAPPVFSEHATRLALVMGVVAMALWFAYEVPAIANTGQSLGKRILRIRVARIDGEPMTFSRASWRWFVLGLPALLLPFIFAWPLQLIDCLWCTWDRPAQQCLHDKGAQTVVVNVDPPPT